MKTKKLHLKAVLAKGQDRAIASSEVEDRHGEVVESGGWDLKNFKKHPVLQAFHDPSEPWVGYATATKIDKSTGEMSFVPEFHQQTPLSKAFQAIKDMGGSIAFSVGFMPKEWEGNTYTKQELLEISVVNVPANPQALLMAKSLADKGFDEATLKQIFIAKDEGDEDEDSDEDESGTTDTTDVDGEEGDEGKGPAEKAINNELAPELNATLLQCYNMIEAAEDAMNVCCQAIENAETLLEGILGIPDDDADMPMDGYKSTEGKPKADPPKPAGRPEGRINDEDRFELRLMKAIDKMTTQLVSDKAPNPRVIKALDKATTTLLIRQKEKIKNG